MKILLDNSFREEYCFFYGDKDEQATCNKWDQLITNIENYLGMQRFNAIFPENIESIEIPMSFIESIGFKEYLPNRNEIESCFPKNSELSLLLKKPVEQSLVDVVCFIDNHISKSWVKLVNLLHNKIDIDLLIKSTKEKLKKKVHQQVKSLTANLSAWHKDLVNNKKESELFEHICRDLAWDALCKHKWFSGSDEKYIERHNSIGNWFKLDEQTIVTRLLAYYLDNKKSNDYLSGSVPLNIYGRLLRREKRNNFNSYITQEKVDPYITECAFTGWYDQKSGQQEKVVVLTCDVKKSVQRKRVMFYINAKNELDETLAKLGKQHLFVPGYIICINSSTHQVNDLIDIYSMWG